MGSHLNSLRKLFLSFLALASLVILHSTSALAQTSSEPEPYRNIDEFGVDLSTGTFNFTMADVTGGSAAAGVDITRTWGQSGWKDAYAGHLSKNGSKITIVRGTVSEIFNRSGSTWVAAKANGSTLVEVSTGPGLRFPNYTYTGSDGTVILYQSIGLNVFTPEDNYPKRYTVAGPSGSCKFSSPQDVQLGNLVCAVPVSITSPAGEKISLSWGEEGDCEQYYVSAFNQGWECAARYRLTGVSDQSAYTGSFAYAVPFYDYSSGWWQRSKAYLTDRSTGVTTEATYSVPSSGTQAVVDQQGLTWTFTFDGSGRMISITKPGASSASTTIAYGTTGKVSSVTKDGVTRTYTWSTSGSDTVVSVTGGSTGAGTITTAPTTGQPKTVVNGTSNTLSNLYDANGRITRTTWPEGNYVQYTYDARGNLTLATAVPKVGSGQANITSSANYDTTCSIIKKCNSPNYTIDARGNRTDYTYSSVHGQVTQVQLPAPAAGQPRPQVNYSYTALYAQEKNSSGVLVNVATPQYKLTQIMTCASAATCAGTASETKITLVYNTPNLQPTSVTVAAGDGSVSATSTFAYDLGDNLASVDGPLAGSADSEFYFYDSSNRKIGTIGPDPDGAGANPRPASRITYDTAGRISKSESGTATGNVLANLAAMTVYQTAEIAYDANGRASAQTFKGANGVALSLVQYSYDGAGRLECTATRMNPAAFSSLPASACSLGAEGSYGPDRIAKAYYDAAGRPVRQESGVGTLAVGDDGAVTYTANGLAATATDGEANRTTYEYDGHDRVAKVRLPIATKGANASSTTDYEQLTYNANGAVTQHRLRDGQLINYSYDNLDRLTFKDVPNSVIHEYDISYQYNLLGQLTQALDSNTHVTNFVYDALGRQISESSNWTTRSSQYDAAGRRTRLTWGDGFYVTYEYDVTGNVIAIKENGAALLAAYSYDSFGRRTQLTYGNGVTQTYAYDTGSRLQSLTEELLGTSYDQTASFAYNPAAQIATVSKSNDSYAWTGHFNVDRPYSANGLNQLTNAGATALGYDERGNLTTSGTSSYTYTSENRLATAPGGYAMAYDPLGRYHFIANAGINWMQYDGGNIIEERGETGVLKRYVYGPGNDAPIVWYEGSGTTNKHYLIADERGSITAVTGTGGALLEINRYDEYGIPADTNIGRFGYTGQAWIPELGMSYYKARIYSPTLGRFMQTDPVGYADGMNWYNYVGSDPVNAVDPTGLGAVCKGGTILNDDDEGDCKDEGGVAFLFALGARGGGAPFGGFIAGGGGGGGNRLICAEGMVIVLDSGGQFSCAPPSARKVCAILASTLGNNMQFHGGGRAGLGFVPGADNKLTVEDNGRVSVTSTVDIGAGVAGQASALAVGINGDVSADGTSTGGEYLDWDILLGVSVKDIFSSGVRAAFSKGGGGLKFGATLRYVLESKTTTRTIYDFNCE